MKCIFSYVVLLFCCLYNGSCLAQKVLLIKRPIIRPAYDNTNFEENIYFERDIVDQNDDCPRTAIFQADYTDSIYIVKVYEDSLAIFSYNPMDITIGADKKHNNSKTPSYLFKHLLSYPHDTIVVSGLAFTAYHDSRISKMTYSWRESGDSINKTKPVAIGRSHHRSLVKTLSSPHLKIGSIDMRKYLLLKRTIGMHSTWYCSPPKYAYYCEYEDISFTFTVDLALLK